MTDAQDGLPPSSPVPSHAKRVQFSGDLVNCCAQRSSAASPPLDDQHDNNEISTALWYSTQDLDDFRTQARELCREMRLADQSQSPSAKEAHLHHRLPQLARDSRTRGLEHCATEEAAECLAERLRSFGIGSYEWISVIVGKTRGHLPRSGGQSPGQFGSKWSRQAYSVLGGDIIFNGSSILDLDPEERSHLGIFLAFQYPIEIPGVSNEDFLRLAYNAKQKFYNKPEVDPIEFLIIIDQKLKLVNMSPLFLSRNVNEGFSGVHLWWYWAEI